MNKKTKTRYRDCTIALLIISFLLLPVTIAAGQDISKAAKELGLTRASLYRRLEKHGL